MNIEISPKKILIFFIYIISFLLFANIIGIISRIVFDINNDYILGIINLFNFNSERNIPSLYSSITLVFSSMILFFISLNKRKEYKPFFSWVILSLIFLFLSIDEIASLHEMLSIPTRELLGTSGFFYYAWIIPYGLALIIFIISYLKFLFNLPKNIMMLFLLSGGIFVLGAIGFEMLGGWQVELYGNKALLYSCFYTCEEFLEMLGIAIFIYTLLKYILSQNVFVTVTLQQFSI